MCLKLCALAALCSWKGCNNKLTWNNELAEKLGCHRACENDSGGSLFNWHHYVSTGFREQKVCPVNFICWNQWIEFKAE